MIYQCPTCKSDNIQKASVVYGQGTSTSRTSGSYSGTIITDAGNWASQFGDTESIGVQSTLNAQCNAPPARDDRVPLEVIKSLLNSLLGVSAMLFSPVFIFVMLGDGESFMSGVLMLIFGIGWYFYHSRKFRKFREEQRHYNEEVYPKLMEEWNKRWLCNKCGYTGALYD